MTTPVGRSAAPTPATERGSLAWRITAGCLLVALVAVGVAGLVSLRLVGGTSRAVTQQVQAEQADVVAAQLGEQGLGSALGLRRVAEVLRGQGVSIVLITGRGSLAGGDDTARAAAARADVDRVLTGSPVSRVVLVEGRALIVEARAARGGGFALVRAAERADGLAPLVRRNVGVSLVAGGLTAVVVGWALSRVLARPLRRTAEVARSMRSGRRDTRVPVEGPAEVADLARTVNELADALALSEGRQRAFLLSVSHELRTPLTAVTGFAESLADGVVTGPDVAPAGATILREAQRLDRLVADLLELARAQADDFRLDVRRVELTALVAEAAQVWSARGAAAGVRFRLEAPEGPVWVDTDPRRLRQVLDGLAENALRVLPAGAPLVLGLRAGDGGRVLEVRDGGPGLAPEDYPVAFEPGRLHEAYRGRRVTGSGGVGLALARSLVTRLGGTITAGPAPEGGARFTVTLPRPADGGVAP